jgi:hypothetical protein
MPIRLDEYRDYVLKRKFTQNPSFYSMEIPGGGINNDRFFACYPDNIIIPGRNFLTTPFSYIGPEYPIPVRREYNDFTANFIVYQDWKERQFFENWMDSILPYNRFDGDGRAVVSDIIPQNLESKTRTITVKFSTRNLESGTNAVNFRFEFINAYPSLITPTAFSADNSGYTVFTVNFSYRFYNTYSQTVDVPTKAF